MDGTKDKKNPAASPEATLVLSDSGDVGLTYDQGFFETEPVCVVFDEAQQKLSVVLKSGATATLSEKLEDRFINPLRACRRVLLMEVDAAKEVTGYGLPLLKKSVLPARVSAVA